MIKIITSALLATMTITAITANTAWAAPIDLGISYMDNRLADEAQATANRSLDSSNLTGEIYSVGLIKRF